MNQKRKAGSYQKVKGLFKIKSLVIHRVGFAFLVRFALKSAVNALQDFMFRPAIIENNTIFVVGCGHTGTTLMAAKMGQHSKVLAIGKESNVFIPYKCSLYMSSRILSEVVDVAIYNGKTSVLEKTPKHLYFIDRIQKVAPDCKIIAMTRNPLDTVSSLYKRFDDLELCVERWINDNTRVLSEVKKGRVMRVRYEDLTAFPEKTFHDVCKFTGLSFESSMLDGGRTVYLDNEKTSSNMRIRSRQVSRKITNNFGGWRKVLSEAQAHYVVDKTKHVAAQLGYHFTDGELDFKD